MLGSLPAERREELTMSASQDAAQNLGEVDRAFYAAINARTNPDQLVELNTKLWRKARSRGWVNDEEATTSLIASRTPASYLATNATGWHAKRGPAGRPTSTKVYASQTATLARSQGHPRLVPYAGRLELHAT